MQLYKERMTVGLRTDYIKEHNIGMYPSEWNVECVVVREPVLGVKTNRYRQSSWFIHEWTHMKKEPVHLILTQPIMFGKDKELLPAMRLTATPSDCIIDNEFLDQVDELKPWELGLVFPVNIKKEHIKEALIGNTEWWESEYDERIRKEKEEFKKDTGLEFDDFTDESYRQFVYDSVLRFLDKINPSFKRKTGKKLYIRYDPLYGDWVTTDPDGYGRNGHIIEYEDFWNLYIRGNETNRDNIRPFSYVVDQFDNKWKKFDLTKYFKNYESV